MVGILILDFPPSQASRVHCWYAYLNDPPHPALGSPAETNIRERVRISASDLCGNGGHLSGTFAGVAVGYPWAEPETEKGGEKDIGNFSVFKHGKIPDTQC